MCAKKRDIEREIWYIWEREVKVWVRLCVCVCVWAYLRISESEVKVWVCVWEREKTYFFSQLGFNHSSNKKLLKKLLWSFNPWEKFPFYHCLEYESEFLNISLDAWTFHLPFYFTILVKVSIVEILIPRSCLDVRSTQSKQCSVRSPLN